MLTRTRGGAEARSCGHSSQCAEGGPICAVLTPAGRGAIATIAVEGAGAVELVARLFTAASGQSLEAYAPGSVVFGRFAARAARPEDLVVGLPRPEYVEVHCHGGLAAVQAILGALVGAGARRVDPALFVRSVERDPLRSAALASLCAAKTARTAAVLLDQCRGALASAIHRTIEKLAGGDTGASLIEIEQLLARAGPGLHLTTPWRVVLAGPANAGKSSLMNAVMGFERSIVFPEPGTTRDVLSAATAIEGWPVELLDTAGLRETSDPLEAEGACRAREELAAADLVLYVVDVTVPWDEKLFADVSKLILRAPRVRNPLLAIVYNKCDLSGRLARREEFAGQAIAVSAKTGEGVDALCRLIARTLVPDAPAAGAAVPFEPEQVRALQGVLATLQAGDAEQGRAALEQLVGIRTPPA